MTGWLKIDWRVNNMGVKERRVREGNARLDAILAAAETVFARDGYQQARMEDIAAAAERPRAR
jgi:AcrR family transcriptional regulator